MIDKDIAIVDIDPAAWRNLGKLREELIPRQRILTVIRENGKVVAAFDEARGQAVEISDTSESSPGLAKRLYEEAENLDLVRVLEREALREFERETSDPSARLDRDEYLEWARILRRTKYGDRLAEYPPYQEERETFGHSRLRAFVEEHDNSVVFIAVFAGNKPFFNLIFGIKNKKVILLTTGDAFGGEQLDGDFGRWEERIAGKFGRVSAGVMIEKDSLTQIFEGEDKEAAINTARENGGISGKPPDNSGILSLIGLAFFFWPAMRSTVYVNYV